MCPSIVCSCHLPGFACPLKSIVIWHHFGTALALLSPGGAHNSTPLSEGHQIGGRWARIEGYVRRGEHKRGALGTGGLPDRVGGLRDRAWCGCNPRGAERMVWRRLSIGKHPQPIAQPRLLSIDARNPLPLSITNVLITRLQIKKVYVEEKTKQRKEEVIKDHSQVRNNFIPRQK